MAAAAEESSKAAETPPPPPSISTTDPGLPPTTAAAFSQTAAAAGPYGGGTSFHNPYNAFSGETASSSQHFPAGYDYNGGGYQYSSIGGYGAGYPEPTGDGASYNISERHDDSYNNDYNDYSRSSTYHHEQAPAPFGRGSCRAPRRDTSTRYGDRYNDSSAGYDAWSSSPSHNSGGHSWREKSDSRLSRDRRERSRSRDRRRRSRSREDRRRSRDNDDRQGPSGGDFRNRHHHRGRGGGYDEHDEGVREEDGGYKYHGASRW